MAPPLLHVRDIEQSFGNTQVLDGAECALHAGERLCVVGRNGSGKSTLLKVMAGLIEPDEGSVFIQPGTTIRYLPQEPDFTGYATIGDYVEAGLAPGDDHYRAQALMQALGLTGEEYPKLISGGEARRAALARTLAPKPDVLLLDEPTNHLDLPSIEWLERELSSLSSALVLISHDRRFLEQLSRKTLWVDRGQCRLLNKGFGAFEDWRDEVLEAEELEQHKLARKIVREEHWLRYGVTARRKRNVRRLKNLGELRAQKRDFEGPKGNITLNVAEGRGAGKIIIDAKNIGKAYGEQTLIQNFSCRITRGSRVGIVGPNGAGKTTLLNMLIGELAPDTGTIKIGDTVDLVSMDQNRSELNPEWSLKEALTNGGDMVDLANGRKHVMAYMKDFLFTPDQAGTPVGVLSGGEKARLMLARALALPGNFLVLDEPTNDLDLETLGLLQAFLSDYAGTVMLVSHDRDFLDRVTTSIIVHEGPGQWREYPGGYSDMLRQRKAAPATKKKNKKQAQKADKSKPATGDTKSGKVKLTFKDQHALKTLPLEIEALEKRIEKINAILADPDLFTNDRKRFDQASAALVESTQRLEEMELRWLELDELAGGE
ncbi:MAG: ABC-F family ATP-binding cassette domain-containing protein [Robiginitomaculum sp.]|nr:ABC-F family ATP-binding cassette domain-containing protein [Robiginitomaculum sp.]